MVSNHRDGLPYPDEKQQHDAASAYDVAQVRQKEGCRAAVVEEAYSQRQRALMIQ